MNWFVSLPLALANGLIIKKVGFSQSFYVTGALWLHCEIFVFMKCGVNKEWVKD
jgi:hypothetical protein